MNVINTDVNTSWSEIPILLPAQMSSTIEHFRRPLTVAVIQRHPDVQGVGFQYCNTFLSVFFSCLSACI